MLTAAERFWSKVEVTDSCWLWNAGTNGTGYGSFRLGARGSRAVLAHRWAYEFCGGVIPERFDLDHLCRVTRCVRPEHLEPVPHAENVRRGLAMGNGWWHAAKTHCPSGHPYDEKNTYLYVQNGKTERQCRACSAARARNRKVAA